MNSFLFYLICFILYNEKIVKLILLFFNKQIVKITIEVGYPNTGYPKNRLIIEIWYRIYTTRNVSSVPMFIF